VIASLNGCATIDAPLKGRPSERTLEYDEYAWLDLQEALEDRDQKYRAENDAAE
jgi:hypothetical protein